LASFDPESAAGAPPASSCPSASPPGALTTSGNWLVDGLGDHIRLAGVTWDAMQTVDFVPAGLEYQSYQQILCTIKEMGFNTVRIPLSDQLVRDNASITIANDVNFTLNPTLQGGLHPLDVLDRIVAAAQHIGLMIILDNHFSGARQCPKKPACPGNVDSATPTNDPGNPYPWLDSGYTEAQWIQDWVTLAQRYGPGHQCGSVRCRNQTTVIGCDLRNEPHTDYAHHSYRLADYLTRGATWGPYPDAQNPDPRWNPNSDWAAAATGAGDAILGVNPGLIMFVEGVQLYPDPLRPHGVEVYSRGGILRGVQSDPIQFTVDGHPLPNHLVYSAHEWGPRKNNLLGEFSYKTTFKTMRAIFRENWAFILHESSQLRAPIWLGEFNTCNTSRKCISAKGHGSQGQWFQIMLEFLQRNPEVGWSYYPVNGRNWLNQPEGNGLFKQDWKTLQLPALVTALRTVAQRWPLTITASSATTTYGESIPTITAAYGGLKFGQTTLQRPPVCGTSATAASEAGTYLTSCTGAADSSYDIHYVAGTLSIGPADSATKLSSSAHRTKYGQTVKLSARVTSSVGAPSGSVQFMDGTASLGQATIVGGKATLRTTAIGAGSRRLRAIYIPVVNSLGATNYARSKSRVVRIVVATANLTITPYSQRVSYHSKLPALTWSADFLNGDGPASMATPPRCTAKVILDSAGRVLSPPGNYEISCRGAVDPNYTINYVKRILTVVQAKPRVIYLGPRRLTHGKSAHLSAALRDTAGAGISRRTLRITIAGGGIKQSCTTAKTDGQGRTSCDLFAIAPPPGGAIVVVRFAGDTSSAPHYYLPASRRVGVTVKR
jgi:endoglucanase